MRHWDQTDHAVFLTWDIQARQIKMCVSHLEDIEARQINRSGSVFLTWDIQAR